MKKHRLFRWLVVMVCFSLLLGLTVLADEEKTEEKAKKKTSLVDLARGSRQDRSTETTRRYTNEDLKKAEGNITSSANLPKATTAPPPADGQAPADQESAAEKYYKEILAKVRQIGDLQRQRDARLIDLNELRREYNNATSGVYQNRDVKPRMDAAYKEERELREEVKKAQKELADLKDEARKNGVLPATIRKAEEDGQKMPEPDVPPAIK
ncbi:MAG: hypothetical protein JXQ27_05760 [Acidobacteria bacterium]|nr:hypothetical protein [Acidobacteriota bacterium]